MALTDIIAVNRQTLLFAKKETTYGTPIKPGASDQVLVTGEGKFSQPRGFHPDNQIRNTHSVLNRFQGRYEVGTFNFPHYVKPSGTLGTKPEGAQVLEGLFGREVVTGGTKVEYFLKRITDTLPSLSIWFQNGHFVWMALGCVMNQGVFSIKAGDDDDALAQLAISGLFAELRWTGTDEADETIGGTPQATLVVKDASKFSVKSFIKVGAQDNGGAGFEVTAVNIVTKTLTLTPTIANVTTGEQIDL